MGREPGFTLYGLFCREGKLGPEERRGFLFNRNTQSPGRGCATPPTPRQGWPWVEACPRSCGRCLTASSCLNSLVYMCPDPRLFRRYLHRCEHGRVRTRRCFCVRALGAIAYTYPFRRCAVRPRDAHLRHQPQPPVRGLFSL